MKFFKSTFIFLSLFLCSLLSAQEAQFEVNLSNEINSNKIENSNIKARVEKFTEEFIQPIMRGDAYDIEIRDIDTIENYQKKNPIICGIPESRSGFRGRMHSAEGNRGYCHDKSSYAYMYDDADLFDDEAGAFIKPFDSGMEQFELNKERSIIISFQIKLKKEFQKSFLAFLEKETSGKDALSYRNMPARYSAEAHVSEYIQCMKESANYCKGILGSRGGSMAMSMRGSGGREERLQEPNYVINFIDRRLEKVTFFNLRNYRSELVRSRKHRFLTNLCHAVNLNVGGGANGYKFSESYLNQNHTQFSDLSIVLYDKNGDAIDEIIINTHQPTDMFTTSTGRISPGSGGSQHTFGLRKRGDFIFSHDYGSNALQGRLSDYLGNRNIMGHLIDDNKTPYWRLECKLPGLDADRPAFSIVSNYEYHLVLQLDRDALKDLSSAQINYVSPDSSREEMDITKL